VYYGSVNTYGTKDVKTDEDGKLYFYLPISTEEEYTRVGLGTKGYSDKYERTDDPNDNVKTLHSDIFNAKVTWNDTYTYTGQKLVSTNLMDISVEFGDVELILGTDYDVTVNGAEQSDGSYEDIVNAGTYDKATITITGKGDYPGLVKSTQIVEIKKAKLMITQAQVDTKEYDGNTDATVSVANVQITGMVNGETLVAGTDYDAEAEFEDKNAGSAKKALVELILKNTAAANNYEFGNAFETTASITKKEVKITSAKIDSKTYDGNTVATVADATIEGMISGETLVAGTDYDAEAEFEDKNAGLAKKALVELILKNTAAANNYEFGNAFETTAPITKKEVKITSATIDSKPYDGNTVATVADATIEGMISGETLDLETDYTLTAQFDNANAGTNKEVSVTLKLGNSSLANNYVASNVPLYKTTGTIKEVPPGTPPETPPKTPPETPPGTPPKTPPETQPKTPQETSKPAAKGTPKLTPPLTGSGSKGGTAVNGTSRVMGKTMGAKTEDSSQMIWWFFMSATSMLVIAVIYTKRRKARK